MGAATAATAGDAISLRWRREPASWGQKSEGRAAWRHSRPASSNSSRISTTAGIDRGGGGRATLTKPPERRAVLSSSAQHLSRLDWQPTVSRATHLCEKIGRHKWPTEHG